MWLIYIRKSVGPRMEPWGTPALTGCSYEYFSSKSQSRLLLKKEEIRPNIWPEILWGRPEYQTLSKALDISSAAVRVSSDLLNALEILSDTTIRRSTVNRQDLKLYWKLKKGYIS